MIELEGGARLLKQWSLNKRVVIDNFFPGTRLEFSKKYDCKDSALPVLAYEDGDHVVADIPNILLQEPGWIRVAVLPSANDTESAPEIKDYKVAKAEKPEDYLYTETRTLTSESLDKRLTELEKNGGGGTATPGEPGGYYTPTVSQPDANTMEVAYTPSAEGMPEVRPVQVTLPAGPQGNPGYTPQKGIDYFDGQPGTDGTTPHIGDNGNWWIGETDTGVSAAGSGGTVTDNGWTKLGDITVSDSYEFSMLSATGGVITIDPNSEHYDYLTSGNRRYVLIPINVTTKEQQSTGIIKVNDATAGTFDIYNRDNIAQQSASYDVTKYKLVVDNVGSVVMENVPDYDNYKMRMTTPVLSTHGLRTYFSSSMTAVSSHTPSSVGITGGAIIEILALRFPYDDNYYYRKMELSYGKTYGGGSNNGMQSFEIYNAGRGINKPPANGQVSFGVSNMIFVNGTRFELWGANDA